MKFKKRDLSEQLGMARSNKKTFTKDAKQKIVVSERQLQRLLGAINEAAAPPKGSNNFACMGGVVGQGGTVPLVVHHQILISVGGHQTLRKKLTTL